MKVCCLAVIAIHNFQKILTITVIMSFFIAVVSILTVLSFLVYGFFTFMGQVCMAILEMWIAL